MNWDDLRVFLAVARAGSISGGARQLDLQHSTVSRRVNKLEADMGVRLFDKLAQGCALTAAGQKLMQAAGRMEQEVLSVDGVVVGADLKLSGPLRVTTIDNLATTVLMPIFAEFSRRNPKVTLHLMTSNRDASLAQRDADVAIRLTNSPPDTLIGKRVSRVASAIYGSRDYIRNLEENGGEAEWLGVECCRFHRAWTRECCEEQEHRFYVDDTLLTQAALRQGAGLSILPCFLGDPDPELERYGEPNPDWELGLWILLHPDLKRTGRVLAFRSFLTEAIEARKDLFEGRDVQSA